MALACLTAVLITWGCDSRTRLIEPFAVEPDPGLLAVELAAPAGARLGGAWLAIEGPDIGALRTPGLDVFESEVETADGGIRREIIVAGPLAEKRVLEFQVRDRRLASLYRVRLIEVTGADFAPRDPSAFQAQISREPPTGLPDDHPHPPPAPPRRNPPRANGGTNPSQGQYPHGVNAAGPTQVTEAS